jgi:hypothetical protein
MEKLERRMMLNKHKWNFAVIGKKGAVHFWRFAPQGEEAFLSDLERVGAGIEQHSRTPLCEENKPPDHQRCWLTEGPCWHDGSSLYAEEVYMPLWFSCNVHGDYEPLWQMLEMEYSSRFADVEKGVA